MKKILMRESERNFKQNQFQPKPIQSQSPPHKKLLKRIETTQKENQAKFEYSLQDTLIKPEVKEEVQDFRIEIERRYQKVVANKDYKFPRNFAQNEDSNVLDESQGNLSMDSLKHVTLYDLSSQNKRVKIPFNPVIPKINTYLHNSDKKIHTRDNNHIIPDRIMIEANEEDVEEPIEIKIRDKSSNTYKKLMKLLENQFNKDSNSISTKKTQNKFEPLKMDNALNIKNNANTQTFVNNISNSIKYPDADQKVVSSYKQKINSRQINKDETSIQNLKKTNSQERGNIKTDINSIYEKNDKSVNHTSNSIGKGYFNLYNDLNFFK